MPLRCLLLGRIRHQLCNTSDDLLATLSTEFEINCVGRDGFSIGCAINDASLATPDHAPSERRLVPTGEKSMTPRNSPNSSVGGDEGDDRGWLYFIVLD
mmetsp:Transcript_2686/g.4159  ORF Transcript_2686/g.4159 Transcript_2686/m.4159 type:complete len:99 (+) Transcript_2686:302-598(+)